MTIYISSHLTVNYYLEWHFSQNKIVPNTPRGFHPVSPSFCLNVSTLTPLSSKLPSNLWFQSVGLEPSKVTFLQAPRTGPIHLSILQQAHKLLSLEGSLLQPEIAAL